VQMETAWRQQISQSASQWETAEKDYKAQKVRVACHSVLCCAVLCLLLWTMSHTLTRVISVEAAGERGQDTSDYLAERKRGAR
jgi:hypothetical protein